jgi:hypothetical protein
MVKITCDVCGKQVYEGSYALLHAQWGYGTRYDGAEHNTIICADCYDELPIDKVVTSDPTSVPYIISRCD